MCGFLLKNDCAECNKTLCIFCAKNQLDLKTTLVVIVVTDEQVKKITNTFNISDKTIELARYLQEYKKKKKKKKSRDIFKRFYKTEDFQEALKLTGLHNPWRHWIKHNSADAVEFKELFKQTFTHVMTRGFAVEQSKISLLK